MTKQVTKQEIIEDLRRVFKQLGRSFNTADYGRTGTFHRDILPAKFGSFDKALEEAGLKEEFREVESKKKLEVAGENKIQLPKVIASWDKIKKGSSNKKGNNRTIFIISDLHAPFTDEIAIEKMLQSIADLQPGYIVQIGDTYDNYSFSRFARSSNLSTPYEEFIRAKMMIEKLWSTIKRLAPKAKLYQLTGNHDMRCQSRLLGKAPELEVFLDLQKPFEIPGVIRLASARDFIEIKNIVFCHGYFSPSGAHSRHFAKSVVFGHTHRGRVEWMGEEIFELNVGHLCNTKLLPFSYTASVITKWKSGWGVIFFKNNKPEPHFIPAE